MKQEAELLCEMSRTCFEELEQELILLYKTDARFGTRKNLLRIGEANGFMSVCCLLRPDWIGCSEEELLRLPEKLVYKFSYQGGLEAVAEALLQCRLNDDVIHDAMSKSNNVEGLFYSRLSPSTANWLQVPGPVGYKKINEEGDVGHLMIEHVEGTSFECHEHCTVTEVEQIIDAVARLQTFSHAEQLHELEEFSWNPWKTIGTCVVTKTVAHKILSETPAFYGAEFEPLTSKLMLALDDLYDLDTPMKELKVIQPVLVHGDIWQSNLMWTQCQDRPRQLKSLLDWQSAHVGSPVEDIVFMLSCVLTGEDRRLHWRSLIKYLYESIEREMAPVKPEFTAADLLASYIRLFPLLGLTVLLRFSVIFKCSLPDMSEEERVKSTERMARKLFLLAEDVVASLESSRRSG